MAKTAKQIQQETFENEVLLNEIANRKELGTDNLPVTEKFIIDYAIEFIKKVQENLKQLNKIDTGGLEKGISKGELQKSAGTYSIEIGYPADTKQAEYYKYVNKGVQGFISKQPNSPYKFRSAYASINGPIATALRAWIKRQGIVSRKETQSTIKSGLQRKRKSISELDSSKFAAWKMAEKIKQRGLPKTGFFDNAIDEYFGDGFAEAMAKAVGSDIRVGVKQVNNLINEKNK